jgi:hypothetical protein
MPFPLKVGQRTRLYVVFLRVDGSRSTVAGPPIWTSSNPAIVRIVEDGVICTTPLMPSSA